MPKIVLKPKSAEFADTKKDHITQCCDMPGCELRGEYKAPKHRGLNEHYTFCLEHIKEYNKAWNFFSGMSNAEVQEHMTSAMYGHRPTWRYDPQSAADDILRKKAQQTYSFTDNDSEKNQQHHKSGYTGIDRNTPEFEALALMGLEPPITLDKIKKRYKTLAKKNQQDLNHGCLESEELLKHINMAYTILKLAYKQFEELPERY